MVRIVSPNSQPMFSSSSSSSTLSWSTPTTTPTTTSTSMTETVNGSHLFNIAGYSLLNLKGIGIGNYVASDTFTAGDYSWAIYFYPDGKKVQYDAPYASLFIVLASEGTDVRAFFELKLLDQSGKGRHKVHTQFDSGPYTIRNRGSMWYRLFFINLGPFFFFFFFVILIIIVMIMIVFVLLIISVLMLIIMIVVSLLRSFLVVDELNPVGHLLISVT